MVRAKSRDKANDSNIWCMVSAGNRSNGSIFGVVGREAKEPKWCGTLIVRREGAELSGGLLKYVRGPAVPRGPQQNLGTTPSSPVMPSQQLGCLASLPRKVHVVSSSTI